MREKWRSVVGYEGLYEVSNKGQIWSLPREDRFGRPVYGKILKQKLGGSTGKRFQVSLHKDGHQATCYVHTLMLEAFVGPRPPGMWACHRDDQPDNDLSKLRWDTPSANNYDLVRNGRHYNATRKRCRSGHLLTRDNISINAKGWRRCRKCRHQEYLRQRDSNQDGVDHQ